MLQRSFSKWSHPSGEKRTLISNVSSESIGIAVQNEGAIHRGCSKLAPKPKQFEEENEQN